MDQKTYLKEMAKHVQRNNTTPKSNNPSEKKIQITMYKNTQVIDSDSMELYREMMMGRFGNNNDQE